LGGFDETLYMYYEETDLSWRARLRGYHSGYVPSSVVHHDYAPARPNLSRFYYTARNRYLLILKNWRLRTLFLLLPGLALAEAVDWFLALAMGGQGLRAKARANGWLLRRPGQIRAQRAAAQAGRTVSDAVILAERVYRLTPLETVLGPVGKAAVAVCNVLFQINHRFALALCRWFGW
jgi:GT2 family glycosyltransferase